MNEPKKLLLEAANENPNQFMMVSEVNGTTKISFHYKTAGDAFFMLYMLRTQIEKSIADLIAKTQLPSDRQ